MKKRRKGKDMVKLSLHNLKRKVCVFMAVVLCQGMITGCSLTKKNMVSEKVSDVSDSLVGVLITQEALPANDEMLSDKMLKKIIRGEDEEEIEIQGKKIYAHKVTTTSEDGKEYSQYEFDIPNSIGCYTWLENSENGDPTRYTYEYRTIDYVADMAEDIGYNEENNSKTICYSGTIYLDKDYLKKKKEMLVYFYNVYQEADGDVYLITEGEGVAFNSDTMIRQTVSRKASVDVTENGEHQKEDLEIKISFDYAEAADRVKVLFFEDNVEVANSQEYDIADITETIKVDRKYKQIVVKSMMGKESCKENLIIMNDEEQEYEKDIQIAGDIAGFLGTKSLNFIVE